MTARLALTYADSTNIPGCDPAFLYDVVYGLSAQQKVIPARWLYDRKGSELFEAITRLPEYYPTRTERTILERNAADMAKLIGPQHMVVEFGSGSASKTPILLSAIDPSAYIPIDISAEFLHESTQALGRLFPALPMHPIVADFTRPLQLLPLSTPPRLGFFPGSTIGNLVAPAAVNLLRSMAATLGVGSKLLIGIDRIKPTEILIPAYNDAQGITAEFNLNLLHRINRELAGDIPVEAFRHKALWNDAESRIEMHLEASRDVSFEIAGQYFNMLAGETIHTENSVKYGTRDMRLLLNAGGWTVQKEWSDDTQLFSVLLAQATDSGALNP
jgi:L-histidine Nalpha-methyltransferase